MIKQISQEVNINLEIGKQVHGYWKSEPIQYICYDKEKNSYLLIMALNKLQKFLCEKEIKKYDSYHTIVSLIEIIHHGSIGDMPYILYRLPRNYKVVERLPRRNRLGINQKKIENVTMEDVVNNWLDVFPQDIKYSIKESEKYKKVTTIMEQYEESKFQVEVTSREINSMIINQENRKIYMFAIDFIYFVPIEKSIKYQIQFMMYLKEMSRKMCFVEIQKTDKDTLIVYPDIHFNTPSRLGKKCIHFLIREWENETEIEVEIKGKEAIMYCFLMPVSYLGMKKLLDYIFKNYSVILIKFENGLYAFGACTMEQQAIICLPHSTDELKKRNSSKTRYNIKREKRLIEDEVGEYSIEVCEGNDIPDEVLRKYFEFKKASHGRDFGVSPKEYIQNHNVSTVYTMKSKTEVLAMCLSCEKNFPNVYFENFSYSPQYKRLSLGSVMYDIYLENLIDRKVKNVFLGNGAYEYKKKYGSNYIVCYTGKKYRYYILDKMNLFCRKIIKIVQVYTKNS